MTMFDSLKALLLPSALTRGSMDGKTVAASATAADFSALLKGVDASAIAPAADRPALAVGAQPASDMVLPFAPDLVAPSTIARAAVGDAEIGQDSPATSLVEKTDSAKDDLNDEADASPAPDTASQMATPVDGTVIGNLLMPPPTPPSVTPAARATNPNIIQATPDAAPQASAPSTSSTPAAPAADMATSGDLPPAHAPLPASPFFAPDAMPSRAPLNAAEPASGKDDASPRPLPTVATAAVQGRPVNGVSERIEADTARLNVPQPLAVAPLRPPVANAQAEPMAVGAKPLSDNHSSATAKPASITPPSSAMPVMASPVASRPVAPAIAPSTVTVAISQPAAVPSAINVSASMAKPAAISLIPVAASPLQEARVQDNMRPQAEATRLLHLVRSQMLNAPASATVEDAAAKVTASSSPASSGSHALVAALSPSFSPLAEFASPQAAPVATLAPVAPFAMPAPVTSVDLGGTIGAQIVDMGVSGQWIDGLARDIAGLSANGGHGRFQINSDQLGTVQVSVRQGAQGTDINLTVANEAAEAALRQDSDRLRTDAALSAVRIADLKIERAPHITESARPDSAGSQGGSQQSGQNGNHPNGQSPGQSLNQSAGQNNGQNGAQARSQGRENFAASHKGADESSVLNHSESRDPGDAVRRRARYA